MNKALNKETILIVDDEPQVLTALSDALEDEFNVLTASSPNEAIGMLSHNGHELSVIMSDQRMPEMNGHEFLSKAKEISEASRLLITGYSDLEAVIAAVNEGKIFGYISKPWDPTALKLVIYKAAEHHHLLQQLREREERFCQLADNIQDVFWMMSLDGQDIYVSPAYEKIWGRSIKELLEKPEIWLEAVHPDDRDRAWLDLHKGLKAPAVFDEEYRIVWPDGSVRWIHDQAFPVSNQMGKMYRYAGIARDITERKENEHKIARLSRVHALLSGINSAIVRIRERQALLEEACHLATEKGDFLMAWIGLYDPETGTVHIVAKAGRYDGYLDSGCFATEEQKPDYCMLITEAMEKYEPVICNDVSTDPRMAPWRERALQQGFNSIVLLPVIVDEKPIGLLALYAGETGFFTTEEIKLLTELSGDISYALQNIVQQEKLDYLAYYDSLTGLPNRILFTEHLSYVLHSAKQTNERIAVLVFDIKQFRHINNAYGKHIGDELLKEVALRLQGLMDDSANIGRITGDYFAVILPKREGKAAAIAEWFVNTVAPIMIEPIVIEHHDIHVEVTGGIAVYPADGEDADSLYHNAEAALKKAKASNEKYLFYQSGMMETIVESLLLQNKMRDAIEEEQFILHYQPKIDVNSHKIIGFEALIRWNDPETGLVPPGKFIPLLEESGLIVNVGTWAMRRAMEDAGQWQSKGLEPVRIAVNVSALQLQQKDFFDVVANIVGQYGGKDCLLDLEVTESLLMQDFAENVSKLEAVRNLGVNISIDDFGTGYSSLSYLTKLPVNALKIDRSFIISMDNVPESMTIVSAIITLAHSLNLKVIAEGVETEEQAKLLRLLKCEQLQGFLFSKPLRPEDVLDFIKQFNTYFCREQASI